MKYYKFFQLSAFLIFISFQLRGQDTWTLNKCIEFAHENNLQIKQARLSEKIASNNYLQSKIQILPSLSASASRTYLYGHSLNSTTNEFIAQNTYSDEYGIASSVTLFAGLQTYNSIKANECP